MLRSRALAVTLSSSESGKVCVIGKAADESLASVEVVQGVSDVQAQVTGNGLQVQSRLYIAFL